MCVVVLTVAGASGSALAQAATIPPFPQSNPIPAPLPPPPQPPEIYGPNRPYQPEVLTPPHLNTFSDRISSCLQQGTAAGLRGGRLQRYSRSCANRD